MHLDTRKCPPAFGTKVNVGLTSSLLCMMQYVYTKILKSSVTEKDNYCRFFGQSDHSRGSTKKTTKTKQQQQDIMPSYL